MRVQERPRRPETGPTPAEPSKLVLKGRVLLVDDEPLILPLFGRAHTQPITSAPGSRPSERGAGFLELICVLFMVGIVSAIAIPALNNAAIRNRVYVGSELIAAQIRGARLAAITRNATFRVRFACPAADSLRMLVVTGDPTIDNATDRCTQNVANDGPATFMPGGVSFGTLPTIEFNGRGQISIPSGTLPLDIVSTYGSFSRTLTVSATGRITTPSS